MEGEEKEGDLRCFFLQNPIFPSSTSRENPAHCKPSPANNFYENQNPRVQAHTTSQNQNSITQTQRFSSGNLTTAAASISFQDSISHDCFDVIYPGGDTLPFDMNPPESHHASFRSSEAGTELNPALDETTSEQGLETLLSRLNLSNPPRPSQFLAPPAGLEDVRSGVGSMRGNINSYDSITASGLAPSTYAQERILELKRIQTALRGQTDQKGRQSLGTMNYDYPFRSSSSPKGIRFDSKFIQTRGRFGGSDDWILFPPPQRRPTSALLEGLNSQLLIPGAEEYRRDYHLSQNLEEWKDHLHELMVHPSYYYQVQKRFEENNDEQLTEILIALISNAPKLARTCTDNHGSRSVQKLLKQLKTPEQIFLAISALRNITVTLAKSPGGQFVIWKCFELFSAKVNKLILNEMAENCLEISTDKVGYHVIQCCVNYGDHEETRERLLNGIIAYAPLLSEHPYGNFVVQYILCLGQPEVAEELLEQLKGRFLMLSMHMHGSHVVERFLLEYEEEKYSSRIIEELISIPELSLNLFQDQWGNYVAQTAKKVAKGYTRKALMSLINFYKPYLENHPHGKCVLAPTSRKKHRTVQSSSKLF